jgi:hypothetical protein
MGRNKTCKKYRTCEEVPCGEMKNGCPPTYCANVPSKNWGLCNMNAKYCTSQKRCKLVRAQPPRYQVLAKTMHEKMPYIWRFLDRKTRRKMINLAKKPLRQLNI